MPRARTIAAATAAILTALAATHDANAQLRVVSYNVAQLQGQISALDDVFQALNDDDTTGAAIAPHVYVFQEVRSVNVTALTNTLNNAAPTGITYVLGTYTDFGEPAGAQAMYYRDDVLVEDVSEHVDIFTGAGRRADRWRLDLVGYDGVYDAGFYIYSMHLKAGSDVDDYSERTSGAQAVRTNADALPAGTHIIYAGDYNLQDHLEPAYDVFLDPGPGQAFDPLGSGSWSGSGNASKHTQSPRNSTGGPLIGGGMDDRFDFQLLTGEFVDNQGFTLLPGTYRVLGNDGSHYNTSINNGNNFYFPGDIPRSNDLADALHDASDHLPVIAEYAMPGFLATTLEADFGRVIQFAFTSVDFTVENLPPIQIASGSETIQYTAIASGAITGSLAGTLDPLGAADAASFTIDTSLVGSRTGLIIVSSPNQGVPAATPSTTGVILRDSNPSYSDLVDEDAKTIALTFDANTGMQTFEAEVHNFGYDAVQSTLDVDAVAGTLAPFQYDGPASFSGLNFLPAVLPFSIDTTGLSAGLYTNDLLVVTSDEDIPGENTTILTLRFEITIDDGGAPCVGDFNGDMLVGFADLSSLLQNWGTCPGCPQDLDENGEVGFTDLSSLLAAWGACP